MSGRIEDIEVLRGLAVSWVVVWHTRGELFVELPGALEAFYRYFGGGSGVDLFFVISGFVITRSLAPILEACSGWREWWRHAVAFWIRRAFRLLPSAWLCLAAIVVASAVFNRSGAFHPLEENLVGAGFALLQLANLCLAWTWIWGRGMGATYHFWSLSLEEQFYLVLPFAFFVGRRALPWWAVAAVSLQLVSGRPNPYFLFFRTDALLLGVLIALVSRSGWYAAMRPSFLGNRLLSPGAFVLLLTISVNFVNSEGQSVTNHPLSVVSLLSALAVYVASYDQGYVLAEGMLRRALVWLGERSYALYLWHIPVFDAVREIGWRIAGESIGHLTLLGAALVTLCLVGDLNFRLVERPLRARGAIVAARWLASRQPRAA